MVQFRLHLDNPADGGEYNSGWLTGAQGAQTLAQNLGFTVATTERLVLSVRAEFVDDTQLRNFVALLCKTWHHICFMSGVELTPPVNPWAVNRETGVDWSRVLPNTVRYAVDGSWHTFEFRLRDGIDAKSAGCVVLRFANMAAWSLKYSDRIKLTTNTRFKWDTFNQIAVHVQPAMEFPTRREPEPEPVEPLGDLREVVVDPRTMTAESQAMVESIGQNLGSDVTSIAFVDENAQTVTRIPLRDDGRDEEE